MTTPNLTPLFNRYSNSYWPQHVEVFDDTGGFSGALIVRIKCPNGSFCLRGWPSNSLPRQRILGLHRLLAHVFQQGVTQVAVPVAAIDGTTLVEFQGSDWQLEPWMPGIADFHHNPTNSKLRAAMQCLAGFHRATARFEAHPEEQNWFGSLHDAPSPAVVDRFQKIEWWNNGRLAEVQARIASQPSVAGLPQPKFLNGPPRLMRASGAHHSLKDSNADEFSSIGKRLIDLYQRAAPRIAAELRMAADLRFQLQPCLRDIWHDHVLFTGDEVTGLIDASACRMENVASDLSRLLGSFVGDDHDGWDNALDAYQQFRSLTLDERALVTILDRSSVLLSGMTWLDRRFLQQQRFANPTAVVDRLRRILVRLEILAASL